MRVGGKEREGGREDGSEGGREGEGGRERGTGEEEEFRAIYFLHYNIIVYTNEYSLHLQ